MATLSQFLAHLQTLTMFFFSILILELVLLARSIIGTIHDSDDNQTINFLNYLKLIEEKSPSRRYEAGLRVEPLECAVCLSPYEDGEEIRKLKCRHTFHKECLDTWLQQDSATCPLCRSAVLPEEVAVKLRRRRRHPPEEEYEGSDEELILFLSAIRGNYY